MHVLVVLEKGTENLTFVRVESSIHPLKYHILIPITWGGGGALKGVSGKGFVTVYRV